MEAASYTTEEDERKRLGLIVLQADETIEDEFRHLIPGDVRLMVSRVPSGAEVTSETLAEMAENLTGAARLFPHSVVFDAVGYACTSGTAEIGSSRVARLVSDGVRTASVTTPVDALVAACRASGVRRLNLLSPYVPQVSDRLVSVLGGHGIEIAGRASFNEAEEAAVARISGDSIVQAAEALARSAPADAMFLSCTNLRTAGLLGPLAGRLGCPVWSSNNVLAWHLLHLCHAERYPSPEVSA